MLRYMLYECNQPLVPLSKELKMLNDYIVLEKIRYGNALDVNLDLPGDSDDFLIAPLLLLPFVENSFKHGASQMLDQPWLSLSITINDNTMHMKLVNAKAENYKSPSNSSGIGIKNARQRLELIYPGKHILKITDADEVFIVDLKLQVENAPLPAKTSEALKKELMYE
jgi:LytS/YehU family sensor histidine kinase